MLFGESVYSGQGLTSIRQIGLALALQQIIRQSAFCFPSMFQPAISYYDGCLVPCHFSALCLPLLKFNSVVWNTVGNRTTCVLKCLEVLYMGAARLQVPHLKTVKVNCQKTNVWHEIDKQGKAKSQRIACEILNSHGSDYERVLPCWMERRAVWQTCTDVSQVAWQTVEAAILHQVWHVSNRLHCVAPQKNTIFRTVGVEKKNR